MGVQIDGQNSTIVGTKEVLNVVVTELSAVKSLIVSGVSTHNGGIVVGTGGSIFSPASNVIKISNTGSVIFPSGTTAQRPESSSSGMLRFNTDNEVFEGYRLGGWEGMGPPVGSIHWMAGSTVPAGYLKANGENVSRTTYARLYSVIGTTYGVGDDSTTFTLPDLRGEFVRSWDDGRGVDSERILGSAQAGSIEGHAHPLSTETAPHAHTASSSTVNAPHAHTASSNTVNAPHAHTASSAAANAPHGHNASSGAANAPHAHPGTGTANAPHGHNASSGTANAPHSHPILHYNAGGGLNYLARNTNAFSQTLVTLARPTGAANAPHSHPVSVAANNAPHSHPVAAGNAPHSHPVSVVANNAPHSHTITVDTGNAPHSHTITVDAGNAPHSHTITVDSGTAPHTHTVGSTGSTETRPRNISLMAVIKY